MHRPAHRVLAVLLALVLGQPAAHALAPSAAPAATQAAPARSRTELAVRVGSPDDVRTLEAEIAASGGRVAGRSEDGLCLLVEAPATVEAAAYADAIADELPVTSAEPVGLVRASALPSDPHYRFEWWLPAVGAPEAWDHTWGAPEVIVAVIDTGIEHAHPDLAGRIVAGGYDFVDDDAVPEDADGHGTGVAGIVAATRENGIFGVGMAPDVGILPIRVLDGSGTGNTFDVAQGVRWAVDHGADVINLSLGTDEDDAELGLAIGYALANDVVVVAASGNSYPALPRVQYPARAPGVIAVGAVDSAYNVASFSNRGSELDLTAPGVSIYSTSRPSNAGYWTGTSMASPIVAGTAALLLSREPDLTVAEVEQRLYATALDLGSAGRDDTFGHGMIRAGRAIAFEPGATPPTQVYRFYNASSGTHFYTSSTTERDMVIIRWPGLFTYEGVAYTMGASNSQPLFRFYNVSSKSHFYTASISERDNVQATLGGTFIYEGEAYKVELAGAENRAVYRFYNRSNGSHFFTASSAERDAVMQQWWYVYRYEGVAFYLGD